ncbi:MAG: hypothetical protein CFE28_10865 [Alphaproteobacteria bacterium PA2]|nr:MAG: hypothetical protein CFE28_10865 [Alphaproteobacteria bacterium PA2]
MGVTASAVCLLLQFLIYKLIFGEIYSLKLFAYEISLERIEALSLLSSLLLAPLLENAIFAWPVNALLERAQAGTRAVLLAFLIGFLLGSILHLLAGMKINSLGPGLAFGLFAAFYARLRMSEEANPYLLTVLAHSAMNASGLGLALGLKAVH